MELSKAKEFIHLKTVINITVYGKMISKMDKANSLGLMVTNIMENGKIIFVKAKEHFTSNN